MNTAVLSCCFRHRGVQPNLSEFTNLKLLASLRGKTDDETIRRAIRRVGLVLMVWISSEYRKRRCSFIATHVEYSWFAAIPQKILLSGIHLLLRGER